MRGKIKDGKVGRQGEKNPECIKERPSESKEDRKKTEGEEKRNRN